MKSSLFLSHKNFFEKNHLNKFKNKYFENLILKNNDVQFVFGDNNYFKNKYVNKTYLIFDKINFILLLKSIFIFSIKDYNLLKYIIKLYSYKPLRAKFDNNGYNNYFLLVFKIFFKSKYSYLFFKKNAHNFKICFLNVHYSSVSIGALRAFNEINKQTIEFQHGYIGYSHHAYSKELFLNNNYIDFLPKKIIVWNKNFQNYVENVLGIESEITGYKYIKNKIEFKRKYNHRVLYTLDWGAEIPEQIIKLMYDRKNIHWILRRHPRTTKMFFKNKIILRIKNFQRNNIVFSDPKIPIEEELLKCDFHLTFESATVHEAAALNTHSYFFSNKHIKRFQFEIESNHATHIDERNLYKEISLILEKI